MGVILIISGLKTLPLCAAETQWDPRYLEFLEPLTSPMADWNSTDFGSEISERDRELLKKYRPHIYIAPQSFGPINFYEDYLPHTVLKDKNGKPIARPPSREVLKKFERSYGASLDYQGKLNFCRGKNCLEKKTTLYGRVFYESMNSWPNTQTRDVIILKYSPVFPVSGLPKKIKWWKAMGANLASRTLDDWHELDIHGAIHIICDAKTEKPIVLLLAQHNHFRSYVIQGDSKENLHICFAERSNEPYICPPGKNPQIFNTVGDPRKFRWVILGEKEPLEGGQDVVYGPGAGAVKINYDLEFLPGLDPLYVSWIPLGQVRKIWGIFNSFSRTGPPGINMNTWPVLKKYSDMAQLWYFKEGDKKAVTLLEEAFKSFFELDPKAVLEYHSPTFWEDLSFSSN